MASDEFENRFLKEAEGLFREVERIHWSFVEAVASARAQPWGGQSGWVPPLNVVETAGALWVLAALPAVAAGDIEVRLDGASLVISGRRTLPPELRGGRIHVLEIPGGPFQRRLHLPRDRSYVLRRVEVSEGLLTVELRAVP